MGCVPSAWPDPWNLGPLEAFREVMRKAFRRWILGAARAVPLLPLTLLAEAWVLLEFLMSSSHVVILSAGSCGHKSQLAFSSVSRHVLSLMRGFSSAVGGVTTPTTSTQVFYISVSVCCIVIFLVAIILAIMHLHSMKRVEMEDRFGSSS